MLRCQGFAVVLLRLYFWTPCLLSPPASERWPEQQGWRAYLRIDRILRGGLLLLHIDSDFFCLER